jgi:hypothetical protein
MSPSAFPYLNRSPPALGEPYTVAEIKAPISTTPASNHLIYIPRPNTFRAEVASGLDQKELPALLSIGRRCREVTHACKEAASSKHCLSAN